MARAVATHLARASKAAALLGEAGSQDEAALLIEAGLYELQAAVAAAPSAMAEKVQQVVNEIAGRLLRAVEPQALAEAIESARA
jgi:hypothetical protein